MKFRDDEIENILNSHAASFAAVRELLVHINSSHSCLYIIPTTTHNGNTCIYIKNDVFHTPE